MHSWTAGGSGGVFRRAFAWLTFGLSLVLAACSAGGAKAADQGASQAAPPTQPVPALPDLGPAPELTNEVWLNSPAPLRLADLRGKVVLLEFWTFG